MRNKTVGIDLSEKQCMLLGASYYLTKYVVTHIENMSGNANIPTEHTKIFIEAIQTLRAHNDEFEQMGTQFINLLEIVSKERYV
jgi:hypothetical protein